MSVATSTAIALAVPAITATGALVAAHETSSGASDAANTTADAATKAAQLKTDAANHAADVTAQSAKEALAFQEAQAQNTAQNDAINREANYRLMAAKAAKFGSIGQLLGLGSVSTPDYVPGVMPNYAAGQPPPAGGPPAPAGPAAPPVPDARQPVAAQALQRPVLTATAPAAAGTSPTPAPGLVLLPDGTYGPPGALQRLGSVGSYL